MPDNDSRKDKLTLLTLRGLSTELLDDLERLFPERCPELDDSERFIWFYGGKRALVRALKQALHHQQSDGFTPRLPVEFQ